MKRIDVTLTDDEYEALLGILGFGENQLEMDDDLMEDWKGWYIEEQEARKKIIRGTTKVG